MHEVGLVNLGTIIIYVQLLNLYIASIDVVELENSLVQSQVAHLNGIGTGEVLYLSKHNTLHADIYGFLATITNDSCLLIEMTQLTGIIGHAHFKLIIATNVTLWIINRGTIAVGQHLFYSQFAMTLVLKLEDGSDRLHVARLACIDSCLGRCQFLSSNG